MSLTNNSVSASSAAAKKTVSASSGTASTTLYTVPAGREAEVYITSTYSASHGSINGVNIATPFDTGAKTPLGPIKLAAGTIIKTATAGTQGVYGIEYDAT